MKKKHKIAILICVLLFIIFLILFLFRIGIFAKEPEIVQEQNPHKAEAAYKSPIDFDALLKHNKDIYGWLEIPGTEISYPVLQHEKDDKYYLNHNVDKEYSGVGALFTEHKYNKNDFSDPVTVIYGHHMRSGTMFGNLQQYYVDDFDKYSEMIIYMPEEEIRYEVFAAVEFSNRHILYYYNNFEEELMMQEFLDDLSDVRAIGSYVDESVEVSTKDQLLVLSTCLQGDRTCRFLVIGKRIK